LKFLEAGHVKDVLSILRWAENPRDAVAAFRVLQLLPGVGPGTARKAFGHLGARDFRFSELASFNPPAAATPSWPQLVSTLATLRTPAVSWHGQVGLVRQWYDPLMEAVYDQIAVRSGDLDKVEQIAATYSTRERFITELTLDPPDATSAEAGPPLLDEDYLTLSTIHSAKGQEWTAVFIINANDGNIPSDLSAGERSQLEEERRLLYVGMTRAKAHLHIVHPHKFFVTRQQRYGDSYVFAPRSRFIPDRSPTGRSGSAPM
jgi:DNA helicase-2/ATP-dependent DNA helicase PcrA